MESSPAAVTGRWTRVRTLGRGASGAEVFLAADAASGHLFAVKSVPARGAAALAREREVMACLRASPHVVPCAGGRACRDGSYQLFLEFAPGGSLADAAAQSGGRLDERDVRRFAADVARGLADVHAAGVVHGDVKPRNVVVGADGRAKLADFGCARKWPSPILGGTPAFMAPEVARGEEQGPAADVWALGCTVLEMATGQAPWSHVVGDVCDAVRVIGYTDAVPEVPEWMSAEARDFVSRCFARRASDRPTAAELLNHPFIASSVGAGCDVEAYDSGKGKWWVSPKSSLDAAFWESDTDDEDEELEQSTASRRIKSLACSVVSSNMLPDWDSEEEDWIDVISTPSESSLSSSSEEEVLPVTAERKIDAGVSDEEEEWSNVEVEPLDIDLDSGRGSTHNVGETDASPEQEGNLHLDLLAACKDEIPVSCKLLQCNMNNATDVVLAQIILCSIHIVVNFRKHRSFRSPLCFFLFFKKKKKKKKLVVLCFLHCIGLVLALPRVVERR